MPELPEVENMVISLADVVSSKIDNVYLSNKKLRLNLPTDVNKITLHYTVVSIKRVSKYIVFELVKQNKENLYFVAHCGMSGRFRLSEDNNLQKHDHVVLYLSNGLILKFNDARRFGGFVLLSFTEYNNFFKNTAPDVFDSNFSEQVFFSKTQKSKSSIKQILLNQSIIGGIGNIYASEILYYSKIHPLSVSANLTYNQIVTILNNTKIVLTKAINQGGSTLKDYAKPNGDLGEFQNYFAVYGKSSKACKEHENNKSLVKCKVEKITQNGRSTFYCNILQTIF